MELPNSDAILLHPMDGGPWGSNGAVGAGVGQQVKPRTCKAGGGWVGGDTCGHIATSQKTACMSLLSTYHDPSLQGGIPPSPHMGSRLAGNVKSSNPTNI
jgi:hypothetical protein